MHMHNSPTDIIEMDTLAHYENVTAVAIIVTSSRCKTASIAMPTLNLHHQSMSQSIIIYYRCV